MRRSKVLLVLGLIALWFSGWILFGDSGFTQTREVNEQFERDLDDLSIPPVLSSTMMNPSWTIAYWIGADVKSSDCVTADEFMDRNAVSKTITRRGNSKTYYLAEYVESCRGRVQREVNRVDRYARKWCAFRHAHLRFEVVCREWEQNRNTYIARMQALDGDTLARYSRFN